MEYFKDLSKDFPNEAYCVDNSRGFPLTSLKAQYIKERLNEVFTIFGWNFEEKFEVLPEGILCFGKLTLFTISKDNQTKTRIVTACGFSQKKKNLGDSYKGASTDALSKAASFVGVGNDVFKGTVDLSSKGCDKGAIAKANTINNNNRQVMKTSKPNRSVYGICPACDEWLHYHTEKKKLYCSNWKNCEFKPMDCEKPVVLPESIKTSADAKVKAKIFYKME